MLADGCTRRVGGRTYLLHDTGLALREGDVATRLVLDELDLYLASLAARLVVIVIIVVGGSAGASSLDTATLDAAIAILKVVVLVVGSVGVVSDDFSRHDDRMRCFEVLCSFGSDLPCLECGVRECRQ